MDDTKPRKVKFTPKAQPRKKRQSTAQKPEEEDGEAAQLLRCFNENTTRQRDKAEKKPAVQVAFDQSAISATPIRTYVVPKGGRSGPSSGIRLKCPEPNDEDAVIAYDADGILPDKMGKHYREPWDYHHSYYPTTLPQRMPHAGDPEILDEQEFGKAARNVEYDESTINPAVDLGLMPGGDNKETMMLFQFPPNLPLVTSSAFAKGNDKTGSSVKLEEGCKLEELAEGFMGKLVIYKSGVIKLKLGETLYDVSPGSEYMFAENAAAINRKDKHCCVLGEVRKHVIVIPDVDSLVEAGVNSD